MSEVWASYCAHGDAATIARSVRTVAAFADGVAVLDAVFPTWESEPPGEDLAQRAEAERAAAGAGVPLRYLSLPGKTELRAAREAAVRMVPEGAWCLVIDGDEELLGDRRELGPLFDALRAGKLPSPVGVRVFTEAVLFPGPAPAVTPEAYASRPLVHTAGAQPRLFLRDPARPATWDRVGRTYGLHLGGRLAKPATVTSVFALVNRHASQSREKYLRDYEWELAEGQGHPRR